MTQPIGVALPKWTIRNPPPTEPMVGRYCRLVPTVLDHASDLFKAFAVSRDSSSWTYLPYGPFEDSDSFTDWMKATCMGSDPLFHTIIDRDSHRPVGLASYLRIEPTVGVIEVGHLHFSPALQRTPAATEAMFLMMKRVFDQLGYRRYEWKCDALNTPSRRAAERLGFQFEGIFRQATIYKGRNRDTAWYSIIDNEWASLCVAFEKWLAQDNFAPNGVQRQRLESFRD
jgi:RimJ/RimL family protein N-acetyltransferase